MNLSLTEALFAENKNRGSDDPLWPYEMTKTISALYNSGGGILRAGVRDDGTPEGVKNPEHYSADKSKLVDELYKYLDPVPPFVAKEVAYNGIGCIEITVDRGVLFPSILRCELKEPEASGEIEHPRRAKKKGNRPSYPQGTIFIRRMNGSQPSSEPPRIRSDWQTALQLWESNRGVSIQGYLLAEFTMIISKWDPFNPGHTEVARWEANCIAGTAATMGRDVLRDGLKEIILMIEPAGAEPSAAERRDTEGSDYKQPLHRKIAKLCLDLGLAPVSPEHSDDGELRY